MMLKINKAGIDILHHFEAPNGPDLEAYLCPAKRWTIGYGNTFYENGARVKKGDKITKERAEELFKHILKKFEEEVASLIKSKVNENQFSALVCFAYNVGTDIDEDSIAEGLGDSTLLKKVNKDPNDPTIAAEFTKWNKSGGKVLNGLIRRRRAESQLYFKK